MIRPLRRRHRVFVIALALVVGPLLVAGLLARRPIPETDLPAAVRTAAPAGSAGAQLHNTGSGLALRLVALADPGVPPRLSVELLNEPKRPELLVYWQPDTEPSEAIGDSSVLLGALVGNDPAVFDLPADALTVPGQLVFYSLTQAEVVDRVTPRLPVVEAAP